MKKIIIVAACMLFAISSCYSQSNNGVKIKNSVSLPKEISKIKFGSAAKVKFVEGVDKDVIDIYINSKQLSKLQISMNDEELVISARGDVAKSELEIVAHVSRFEDIHAREAAVVEFVGTTDLRYFELKLSGAAKVFGLNLNAKNEVKIDVDGASLLQSSKIICDDLSLDVEDASKLDNVEVQIDDLDVDMKGASSVVLSGVVTNFVDLKCLGASHFSAYNMPVPSCKLNVNNASQTEIHVNNKIEGKVSGASSVMYNGDANVVAMKISADSMVEKQNK